MAKQELMNLFLSKEFASGYKLAELVTGPFAQLLVDYSGVVQSTQRPLVILDNACGTGIISEALNRSLDSQTKGHWELTCGDISDSLVQYVNQRIQDEGWPRAKAQLVDAQDTKLPSSHFTHIFAAFGESHSDIVVVRYTPLTCVIPHRQPLLDFRILVLL
jgi:hypothetical protein